MNDGIYEMVLTAYLNEEVTVVWKGKSAIEGTLKEYDDGFTVRANWMGSKIVLNFWEEGIARIEIAGSRLAVFLGPNKEND